MQVAIHPEKLFPPVVTLCSGAARHRALLKRLKRAPCKKRERPFDRLRANGNHLETSVHAEPFDVAQESPVEAQ